MDISKPCVTPKSISQQLSKSKGAPFHDPYQVLLVGYNIFFSLSLSLRLLYTKLVNICMIPKSLIG